ncbi:MAG: YkgJ family cysteine cluster protein [Candidatus Eremiobacterota bacterium]
MKTNFFERLEKIYSKAAEMLDRGKKNFCSPCRFCCTRFLLHGVSQIEYDLIKIRLKEEGREKKAKDFKDYIQKKRDLHGELIHEGCPLYNTERMGCSIYRFRPYSCRYYGFYSPVPEILFCAFHRYSIIYSVKNFYDIVPLAKEFLELRNDYNIFTAKTDEEKVEALYQAGYDLYFQDKKDKSLTYLLQAIFIDQWHWKSNFQLSQLFYSEGNVEESIKFGERALSKNPHNRDIKIHLSLLYILQHRIIDAGNLILDILSEDRTHKIALSIMGYLFYLSGKKEEACIYSQKALSIDPELPIAKRVMEFLRYASNCNA